MIIKQATHPPPTLTSVYTSPPLLPLTPLLLKVNVRLKISTDCYSTHMSPATLVTSPHTHRDHMHTHTQTDTHTHTHTHTHTQTHTHHIHSTQKQTYTHIYHTHTCTHTPHKKHAPLHTLADIQTQLHTTHTQRIPMMHSLHIFDTLEPIFIPFKSVLCVELTL